MATKIQVVFYSMYGHVYRMAEAIVAGAREVAGTEAVLYQVAELVPDNVEEPATTTWYGIKLGPSTYGIFDTFPDDAGRQAHLNGKVAAALMAKASELFSTPPSIEKVDILAAKLPG
jgi:quinol monooxygenase YgiN